MLNNPNLSDLREKQISTMSQLINNSTNARPLVLITSGPTREFFDPVRFFTNGSSGRMGAALAAAALDAGFDVTVVSGPVAIAYPEKATVVPVVSTEEMLARCVEIFPTSCGVIGAAAPCDYQPHQRVEHKVTKQNGKPISVELVETPDILATLGKMKTDKQWLIPFALETCENAKARAIEKLKAKNGDFIVLNGADAMFGESTSVEIINRDGQVIAQRRDTKENVATLIIGTIVRVIMH